MPSGVSSAGWGEAVAAWVSTGSVGEASIVGSWVDAVVGLAVGSGLEVGSGALRQADRAKIATKNQTHADR
ncbi:MAG: hypothetical protein ACWGO1_08635 [Anaerolineales bacterium]